jgi:hypothetical protein
MKIRPKSADIREVAQTGKMSIPKSCELNSLPPVCDNEHMTGYCYCHLCTCGVHKCPGDYKRRLFSASSQFISNYHRNYHRKNSSVTIHKPMPEFRPVSFALNSQSTSQKDFEKQEYLKSESFCPLKSSQTRLKFIGKTSYERNFNKWNESFLEKQYVMEFPTPLRDAKFSTESCYRGNFNDKNLSVYEENNEIARKTKQRSQGIRGIISSFNGFLGNSSQKSDFKQVKSQPLKLAKGPEPILETPDYRAHFTSTYKEAYSNPVFSRTTKKKFAKT